MAYRNPHLPPQPPANPELDAYEQQLLRSARRKKRVVAGLIAFMAIVGMGSCVGPCAIEIGADAWQNHKTKLTKDEAAHMSGLLDPIEAKAKASQAAFEAVWPKIRSGDIGARKDLGACRVSVPGPSVKSKEDSSVSLGDSAAGYGWTFIDLTPPEARSPIVGLEMPQGSIALNNTGTGDRYQLPPQRLRTTTPDKAPTLESMSAVASVAQYRAKAKEGIRYDSHKDFIKDVDRFAADAFDVDVIVFVDSWENPKFTNEVMPPPRETLEALERGSKPVRVFESGLALARAFAWDPEQQKVVCAAQAVSTSSPDITFRSDNLAPLQQDLVLRLEKDLQRAFVAVGDAPPKLEKPAAAPAPTAEVDAGAPPKHRKKAR